MEYKDIKQFRERNKISQEEMADVLGVTRPTYIQIEIGERELKLKEYQRYIKWIEDCPLKGKKDTITKEQLFIYLTTVATPPFNKEEFDGLWSFIKGTPLSNKKD